MDPWANNSYKARTGRWQAKALPKLPGNSHPFTMFWQEFSDGRKSAANGEPIHRQRH